MAAELMHYFATDDNSAVINPDFDIRQINVSELKPQQGVIIDGKPCVVVEAKCPEISYTVIYEPKKQTMTFRPDDKVTVFKLSIESYEINEIEFMGNNVIKIDAFNDKFLNHISCELPLDQRSFENLKKMKVICGKTIYLVGYPNDEKHTAQFMLQAVR